MPAAPNPAPTIPEKSEFITLFKLPVVLLKVDSLRTRSISLIASSKRATWTFLALGISFDAIIFSIISSI